MDRYAVLNEKNRVVNVIIWDGIAPWSPPSGHIAKRSEEAQIGDLWLEDIQEYVRPMSYQKPPEDEVSINERKELYLKTKELLKSSILFLNGSGTLEA